MNSFEILSHTADVRLRVRGETLEDLFEQAVLGMARILKHNANDAKTFANNAKLEKIKMSAPDTTILLVDFLNEILTRSYINKYIYHVSSFKIHGSHLEAELIGIKVDGFDEDIKAVTYHEAKIINPPAGGDKGFETIIVFDI